MAVVWTVLRIIGYVLLAVLALVLLVLFTVLLVPIRYQGHVAKHERFTASIDVTWLIKAICYHMEWDGKLNSSLRILWMHPATDVIDGPDDDYERKKEEIEEAIRASEEEDDPGEMLAKLEADEKKAAAQIIPQENSGKEKQSGTSDTEGQAPEKEKKSLTGQVKKILLTLNDKKNRSLLKLNKVLEFMQDDRNIRLANLGFEVIRKLTRHVLPRSMKGYLTIGSEDPAETGKTLSLLALAYPVYHENFRITPVFGEKVFDAEADISGRIVLMRLLILGLGVWFNRDFRRLMKFVKSL